MSELDNTEYQEYEKRFGELTVNRESSTFTSWIEYQEYEKRFGELNKDEEFLSYCRGMKDEYKFTKEDLLEFVSKIIHSAGFHEFLERASSEIGFDYNREGQLDSDLMGCYGIKMAAEKISELTTSDEGYSYVVEGGQDA